MTRAYSQTIEPSFWILTEMQLMGLFDLHISLQIPWKQNLSEIENQLSNLNKICT